MPRRFAPLLTSIWNDPDFQTLTPMAQRMYLQVLSQKRLSLCGVVPYQARNWARGCTQLTEDDVEVHIQELIDRGYVWVDRDTEELVVRTMIKHDPPRGSRTIAGMWNDWKEIDSPHIRHRVIHSLPTEIWCHEYVEPPEDAKPLRNTPLDTPSTNRFSIENESGAASCLLPPSPSHHPPSSAPSSAQRSATTSTEPLSEPARRRKIVEAVANARAEGMTLRNRTAWLRKVRDDIEDVHGEQIEALMEQFPAAPPEVIAAAIEGNGRSLSYFADTEPEPTLEPDRRLTPEERQAIIDNAKDSA